MSEGASVTVRFRRVIEGETRYFELSRSWRQGIKGIEETVRVLRDGRADDVFTDHWDEVIEAYLPSSIAHLFFFDGEQIMELADGGHAAEILGTAVHSLLGLDLVDRLETDLKVFERRKRAETWTLLRPSGWLNFGASSNGSIVSRNRLPMKKAPW